MKIKATRESPARVVLDASNLAVGGGVQVAASLVDELARLQKDPQTIASNPWLPKLTFHLSPEVFKNLTAPPADGSIQITRRRWSQPTIWLGEHETDFDLQLTVFGPRYGRRLAPITVTGLADVTSIYTWPEGVPRGSAAVRLKRGLRGAIARHLFSRESFLVSESESLLRAFHERSGFDLCRTQVIPNVVNRAVSDVGLRAPLGQTLKTRVADRTFLLAYVARVYPHKNHAILPKVCAELRRLGMSAKFAVTLTEEEWAASSDELKEACINVGVIPVNRVADLNLQCDATVFPSLLESFSATPLEALLTNGLLFASDRPFVRDVCGDAAAYFDPLDAHHCAQTIFNVLTDDTECARLRIRAAEVSAESGTGNSRALAYAQLVTRQLANWEAS